MSVPARSFESAQPSALAETTEQRDGPGRLQCGAGSGRVMSSLGSAAMRTRLIAAIAAGTILGLAGCGSDGTGAPRVDYVAARQFCSAIGGFAGYLATAAGSLALEQSVNNNPLLQAGREIDATDQTHPGMETLAVAIANDDDGQLGPDVAKAQRYCADVGLPQMSGTPGNAPWGLPWSP